MNEKKSVKVGQTVVTRFGETLTVLEIRTLPERRKKGEIVAKEVQQFLAQSGDAKCWFDLSHIKEGA